MTSSRSLSNRAAWAVPLVTVGVVVAAALAPSAAAASAHPRLPAKSAAELLAALQSSHVQALSGSVVETARLGLPSLPGADSSASMSWQSLVTGTHTAQVWLDGPQRQRLALLGQLAESDVVHNGRDLWTYSSADGAVTHSVSAPEAAKADKRVVAALPVRSKDVTSYTPMGAAQAALSAIDPTTAVSVDRTARVAGEAAYTLVLAPRDARSTIRRVLIAIDARYLVPLRVQVYGPAAQPAFEIGFATVSFRRPAASVFAFTPPKGSTVTGDPLDAIIGHRSARADAGRAAKPGTATPGTATPGTAKPASAKPTVIGSGWTSVLAFAPGAANPLAGGAATTGRQQRSMDLMSKLTVHLPNGDTLLHTALLNALMTPDGRMFLGAVDVATLEQVASGHTG